MKAFEKVKKLWWPWDSEENEDIKTPSNINVIFQLKYKELIIGYLRLLDGEWSFEYSQEFKNQSEISTLTEFPEKNKIYRSKALYPFFFQRIPSKSQPKVRKTLERDKIKSDNLVELLKKFGRISIANPFQLQAQF